MTLFLSFILGMMITVVLIPPLISVAAKWNMVDAPGERKIHLSSIPRIGGVAMVFGTLLPVILLLVDYPEIQAYIAAMLILLLFGALDDKYNINYKWKFLGQLLATTVLIVFGDVLIENLSFLDIETLPSYISIPFTVIALLGVTNAINLSDGLDGLAGGLTLLSLGGLALIAYATTNNHITIIALAVMGSILGFLRFNTYPARIFMGDTGSQFLGFTLGVAVILLSQQQDMPISSFIPLLVLGLPIIDTLQVMVRRITRGLSPFRADNNHIHHQLLSFGFNHYEAVLIIYLVQAVMVGTAYLFRYEADMFLLLCYAVSTLTVLTLLFYARHYGWKMRADAADGEAGYIKEKVVWLRSDGHLRQIIIYVTMTLLIAYFSIGIAGATRIPKDTGILSLIMLFVLFVHVLTNLRKEFDWIDRVVFYTLGAVVVYIVQNNAPAEMGFGNPLDLVFIGLLLTIVLGFKYANNNQYIPTLLDVLILFLVSSLIFFPEIKLNGLDFKISLTRIVVLFYAIELILAYVKKNILYARALVAISLGVIATGSFIH